MNSLNEPFENWATSPESDLPEFVGLNLEALTGLATFADLSEGFTIAFAEVNFGRDADLLMEALQQRPECQDIQFEVLTFADPHLKYLLEELKRILPTLLVESDKKLVLVLRGLEQAIGITGDYPPFLNDLNFVRDAFPKWVPHPLIFVLPTNAITRIARFAVDFWSWNSGVFKFQTARQILETVQSQQLRSDRMYGSDAKPVKQERINQLQSYLQESVPLGQELNPSQVKTRLNLLLELGDAYESLSDFAKARDYYREALELARDSNRQTEESQALRSLGTALPWWNNAPEALELYHQALNIDQEINNRLGEASTLKKIGDVLHVLTRSDEALQRYEEALNFYRTVGDRVGQADTLKAIGHALQFLDRRDEGISHYKEALRFYREIGDQMGEADILKAIGGVLRELSRCDEALARYDEALSIYREIGDRLGEATTLEEVGKVLHILHRNKEALVCFEEALVLRRAIGDRKGAAQTLDCIGVVHSHSGHPQRAIEFHQQAQQIFKDIGDQYGEVSTLSYLGNASYFLGEYQEALAFYQQILKIHQQVGSIYNQALTWFNIGSALSRLDQKWEARNAYQAARDLYHQIGLERDVEKCEEAIRTVLQNVAVTLTKAPEISAKPAPVPDWWEKSLPAARDRPRPHLPPQPNQTPSIIRRFQRLVQRLWRWFRRVFS